MTDIRQHPTHRRTTEIGAFAAAGVGIAGGGLAAYVGECENGPVMFIVGISLFGLGGVAFSFWALFTGLFLKCPQCKNWVFRWGESGPAEKTFYCKKCDIAWNSRIVVGGPD